MQIADPYARILDDEFNRESGRALLQKIEFIGRISHRSEDAQTENSWQRFISFVVLTKGDWSITEHASVTVDMLVDRGITHELVRHRLASYTQESTRFVNYEKKMPPSFIVPLMDKYYDSGKYDAWCMGVEAAEVSYKTMLAEGCPPQIARSVLPNSLASRIVMTCNLRNWRHFLLMRTTKETHPQMKQVTIPLLAEFKEKIPLLYDDIQPEESQAVAMKKMR